MSELIQSKQIAGGGGGGGGGGAAAGGGGATYSVDDFYPSGFHTQHDGSSHPLSSIFGSLTAAQNVYPWVDDLTPEVDRCAIQQAIDTAFNDTRNVTTIALSEGRYVTDATIFLDPPSSLRNQAAQARWSAATTYAQGTTVNYNGVPFTSLQNGNQGHAPFFIPTDQTGPDPWWQMYYAKAATVGSTGSLGQVNAWNPTLQGKLGHSVAYPAYGVIIRPKYCNMIAVIMGSNNGGSLRGISIFFPGPVWVQGGCNPYSCGVAIAGNSGGASGTTIESVNVTYAYTCFRWWAIAGLGDRNVLRNCGGGGSYRFLSYANGQAYINQIHDCFPASIIGISGAPGQTAIFGGNWSTEQESSAGVSLSISNVSAITQGSGNGYWQLGDVLTSTPLAQYFFISMDVNDPLNSGEAYLLLSNAFEDGRNGAYSWFVIVTPSYGPIPMVAQTGSGVGHALTVFGAITPGSGYAPGIYYNIPLTGGSGTQAVANVVVGAGGTVTAVQCVFPGVNYVIGDLLSASFGGGTGFRVAYVHRLNLMIAPHWVDTFMQGLNFTTLTTIQAELQAATKLYATAPVFPFQCSVTAHEVFFENAIASMSLFSAASGNNAPCAFYGGYLDADPSLFFIGPQSGSPNGDFGLAHYYTQKTLPYVWLVTDVIFDGYPWGGTGGGQYWNDPLVVYVEHPYVNFKMINRNSSAQGAPDVPPPIAWWYTGQGQGPGYGSQSEDASALERGWSGGGNTFPTARANNTSIALSWAQQGIKNPSIGLRPAPWSVPVVQPQHLAAIADPGAIPLINSVTVDGTNATTKYPLVWGGMPYRTDMASPGDAVLLGYPRPGIEFESSHNLYNWFQNLTDHTSGGPGVVVGLAWHTKGHSWCVFMDVNTLTFMVPGMYIGLVTASLNYYIVTGVYPGLGFITVGNRAAQYVVGTVGTAYSGTKIFFQPYRLRYIAPEPIYSNTSVVATAGQELLMDTSAASLVLTMPKAQNDSVGNAVPLQGDKVSWYNTGGNNVILDGNGSPINSSTDDLVISAVGPGAAFYKNATAGWLVAGGTATPALIVTPGDNFSIGGQIIGAFAPSPVTYTLKASSGAGVPFTIGGVPSWLTPSATSGTATTGGVAITFTPNVTGMSPGVSAATMTFTNTTTGQAVKRQVQLIILAMQYAAEGDSITFGAGAPAGGYPTLYANAFTPAANLKLTMFATSGAGYNQVVGRLPQMQALGPLKRPGDVFVATVMTGTNDATFGYPAYGTLNRTDYLQKFAAYLDALRTAGWYVIVCTQISRGSDGTNINVTTINPELIALNTEYKLWTTNGSVAPGKHADAICDFAGNATFNPSLTSPPAYQNTSIYLADQTHLLDAGQAALKAIIKPILDLALSPVDHLVVAAPTSATTGTSFSFTVTATRPNGTTDTGYAGTVHFTSTSAGSLPANSTLTSGVGTFSATLNTIGSQTITATDTVNSAINGTSGGITVGASVSNSAFDPASHGTAIVLTGSNFHATAPSGTQSAARGIQARSSGKLYFEFKLVSTGVSETFVGFGDAATAGGSGMDGIGGFPHEYMTRDDGFVIQNGFSTGGVTFPTAVAGDVYGVAVDFGAKLAWLAKNNVYPAAGNPAAGTNPHVSWSTAYTLYPLCLIFGSGSNDCQLVTATTTYSPPSGFSLWG